MQKKKEEKMGNLHEGHRKRVKERFLKEGLESFEDHQLLELLLFFSIPYKDTNEIAHLLLDQYGSLSALFEADPNDVPKICGVGSNTAVLLSLIPQLSSRYLQDRNRTKDAILSSSSAGDYIISLFMGKVYESFYVICLNNQNKINQAVLLHEGTINEAVIYPRLVVETALRHQAASVILAHNHPGGTLRPSNSDIEVTKKIKIALEAISIKVLDHMVVAGGQYYSFSENALL